MVKEEFSRRELLRRSVEAAKGVGAGVLLSCFPDTVLRALEFPKGTRWLEGLRKLRDAARFKPYEHAGTFVGDRENGEWVHGAEGRRFDVYGSAANIARGALREGQKEYFQRGLTIDHTHSESSIRALTEKRTTRPISSIDPEIFDFIGSPGEGDTKMATYGADTIEKYFAMAGVRHAPIEWGMVTARGRWVLKKIQWDRETIMNHPETYQRYIKEETARSQQFEAIHGMAKAWLSRIPAALEKIFSEVLKGEWDDVARTAEQRADVLAFLMLVEGPTLSRKPEIKELYQRDDVPGLLMSGLDAYWGLMPETSGPQRIRGKLVDSLLAGKTTRREAEEGYRKALFETLFLELSWEPHQ